MKVFFNPDTWQKFLDSLASAGGTVMLLFVLTQITFALTFLHMSRAEDIMYLSVGALLGLLKGDGRKGGSGKDEPGT